MNTDMISRLIERHAEAHTYNLPQEKRLERIICGQVRPGIYRLGREDVTVFGTHRHCGETGEKAFVVVIEDVDAPDGFRYEPLVLFHLQYVHSPSIVPAMPN